MSENLSGVDASTFLEARDRSFYRVLKELGFGIEFYQEKDWGKLARVNYSQPVYCGDERSEGGLFGAKASKAMKMFGGILMPAMFRAKEEGRYVITMSDVSQVKMRGESMGINLGAHDVNVSNWGDVHCGMARLLATGALGYQFESVSLPRDVVEIVGEKNHVDLGHKPHKGVGLLINYRSGYTREPDGKLFATDTEVLNSMFGDTGEALAVSAKAVSMLKPDVRTAYIAS